MGGPTKTQLTYISMFLLHHLFYVSFKNVHMRCYRYACHNIKTARKSVSVVYKLMFFVYMEPAAPAYQPIRKLGQRCGNQSHSPE